MRHDILIWLGGEDQEARLGYEGPGCKCEGQARGSDEMDHRDGEVHVEGLALIDQDNGEEQARLQSMNQRQYEAMKWIISFMEDHAKC
jgi:hypothetical protein